MLELIVFSMQSITEKSREKYIKIPTNIIEDDSISREKVAMGGLGEKLAYTRQVSCIEPERPPSGEQHSHWRFS